MCLHTQKEPEFRQRRARGRARCDSAADPQVKPRSDTNQVALQQLIQFSIPTEVSSAGEAQRLTRGAYRRCGKHSNGSVRNWVDSLSKANLVCRPVGLYRSTTMEEALPSWRRCRGKRNEGHTCWCLQCGVSHGLRAVIIIDSGCAGLRGLKGWGSTVHVDTICFKRRGKTLSVRTGMGRSPGLASPISIIFPTLLLT